MKTMTICAPPAVLTNPVTIKTLRHQLTIVIYGLHCSANTLTCLDIFDIEIMGIGIEFGDTLNDGSTNVCCQHYLDNNH